MYHSDEPLKDYFTLIDVAYMLMGVVSIFVCLFQIDVYHSEEPLKDYFTLIDVAYMLMGVVSIFVCLYQIDVYHSGRTPGV